MVGLKGRLGEDNGTWRPAGSTKPTLCWRGERGRGEGGEGGRRGGRGAVPGGHLRDDGRLAAGRWLPTPHSESVTFSFDMWHMLYIIRLGTDVVTLSWIRPPLSKKTFPVGRVGKKNASREVGIFFFFPNLIFFKLECTGGKVKKNCFEKMKKRVPVGPFSPPGRWTGNDFLFEDGLMW